MMKTIVVTGGCGFIGSNLIRHILRETDYHVLNIDALTYAGKLETTLDIVFDSAKNSRYTFVKERIENTDAVLRALEGRDIVGIINCAAESHVDRSINSAGVFVTTNVQGTLSMLECAKQIGCKRFLQVSTDEVYGSLSIDDSTLFTEETPLAPNSPYSASKASADFFVRSFHHTHGMNVVITRCSNNYGQYQFPEKLIPLVITRSLSGEKIPVYGDGLNVRDWIHVEDHCRGIWTAFENGKSGEVYNFGGNSERSNIYVVKSILDVIGHSYDNIEYVNDRLGHDKRYAIDCSKAERELGWKPIIEFEEGLKNTVEWYKDNTEWIRGVLLNI